MISQCCLCITYSPVHTVEYYLDMAKKLIEAGCDEICIKDMAGIGRPVFLGKIVAGIKQIKKDITISITLMPDLVLIWLLFSRYVRPDVTM